MYVPVQTKDSRLSFQFWSTRNFANYFALFMEDTSCNPLSQEICRTWTRKLPDKLQILGEINTETMPCGDRDYLQRETKEEALQPIPRVIVLGRLHVNWNKTFHLFRRKSISPSLQVADQSMKHVPESAKTLKQDLWGAQNTLCAPLAFNPDLLPSQKPTKTSASPPEVM